MTSSLSIRCVTWNVHRAKGTDGRRDPSRVEALVTGDIAAQAPDILALQEADEEYRPHAGIFDVARMAAGTGLVSVHDAPDLRWGPKSHGFLGTILFLSPRYTGIRAEVIDLPGHCHRGAIAVETRCCGRDLRVISTHLSLLQALRVVQMRTLGQYLRRRPAMPTILLGDFNEWRPWGGFMWQERIVGTRFRGPAVASFPSTRPFLPLDRIMADRGSIVANTTAIATSGARIASDHLPVFGEVTLS